MSYTVANQPAKQRPGTVTVASVLLYVAAAIQLASIAVGLLTIGKMQDVIAGDLPGTPDEVEAVRTAATIGVVVAIVVSAIFAIGMAVLGVLVGKGKNPARIVTWVIAGIGALCYTCSVASSALTSSLSSVGGNNADSAEIQRRIMEAVPSWQRALSTTTNVVLLLIFVAVIILLALPASNDFFRKEQEVWVPPTYPGDPGPPGGGSTGPTGYPAPPQP
jgi:hypothetical protein